MRLIACQLRDWLNAECVDACGPGMNKEIEVRSFNVVLLFLLASVCCAQESGNFQPATTNVWGAEYPRVDGSGRVQLRVKAPEATKVRVNFWSGPKVEMEKQADGFWTVTTTPLVPGLHYYMFLIDGARLPIQVATRFLGEANMQAPLKFPNLTQRTTRFKMYHTARCGRFGTTRK